MLHRLFAIVLLSFFASNSFAIESFQDLKLKTIDGKDFSSEQTKGKVILVVNTASKCGFTPQLKDLQDIWVKYKDRGLLVLAFPSNDFKQDPAESNEVATFAKDKYGVTFPLMEKGPVTGKEKQPAYEFLTSQKSGILFREVSWNFEKFLVGRDGKVIERWNSMTSPSSAGVIQTIEKALNQK